MSLLDRRPFLKGSAKAAGALLVAGPAAQALATGGTTPYVCGISNLLGGDTPPIDVSGTISGNTTYTNGFRVPAGTTLTFDPNVSTTITVSGNVVVEGTLKMRPANGNIIHKLLFTNVDENAFVGGGVVPLATDVGLWVMEAGKLDCVGEEKVAWNRAGWDSGWKSTDEVRIAPTSSGDYGGSGFSTFSQGDSVPQIELEYPLPASLTFSDTFNSVHRDNIEALAAAGITKGCTAGRFCPRDLVTRGQMAAFLNRALGLPAASSAGFVDTVGNTFEDDIDRRAKAGITQGCDATHFCPNDPVTRGQMAAFLVRALSYGPAPSAGFSDTVGHFFEDEIDRLANEGVTIGCTDNLFCPDDYVTREQMASFLTRALDLPIPELGEATTKIGAEVLNLTRNVKIEGTPSGRAHILIKSSQVSTIENIEIRHMGPRQLSGGTWDGVLGRYELHFHFNLNDSRGTVVKNTVVAETGFHAFVPHSSHGITFQDCISYDTYDDAYWWDKPTGTIPGPPDETDDVLYDRCVAAYVQLEKPGYRLAGYMFGAGTGSTAVGSVAVGVQQGGKGFKWPELSHGVWGFVNCVAHNNQTSGIFVWQNTPDDHVLTGFVGYRNGFTGIEHGAYNNRYHFNDCLLVDNGSSGVFLHCSSKPPPSPLTFSNIVVKGPNPITTTKHTLDTTTFTEIEDSLIVSTNGTAVLLEGGNQKDLLRLTDCTLEGGGIVLEPDVHPASIVEVVENGVVVATYTP